MFKVHAKKTIHSLASIFKLKAQIVNTSKLISKNQLYIYSHNTFCKDEHTKTSSHSKHKKPKKKEEPEPTTENNVEDTLETEKDKEIQTEADIEKARKLKEMMATLTAEEFEAIQQSTAEHTIMEIKEKNRKFLIRAKTIALYVNLPLSVALVYVLEYSFGEIAEADIKKLVLYYIVMLADYFLFFNGVLILTALRNFVKIAKYIPKDKTMEFTKLNWLCKEYIVKEKAENLKRMPRMPFSPFVSLRSKKTNVEYSMNGIGDWRNIKLYNTLFPIPPKIKRKRESAQSLLDK